MVTWWRGYIYEPLRFLMMTRLQLPVVLHSVEFLQSKLTAGDLLGQRVTPGDFLMSRLQVLRNVLLAFAGKKCFGKDDVVFSIPISGPEGKYCVISLQ